MRKNSFDEAGDELVYITIISEITSMIKEFRLTIIFSKDASDNERDTFCNSLIHEIEELRLTAGGGYGTEYLDWIINYSDAAKGRGELIDRIGDFLLSHDNIVLSFGME